jgi:hypothetical protein
MGLIDEKTESQKSRDTVPLSKDSFYFSNETSISQTVDVQCRVCPVQNRVNLLYKKNAIHFQCKLCYLKINENFKRNRSWWNETKRKIWSEKKRNNGFSFSLEHGKTKRNGSYFASFRFEAKKIFKQNRRTLLRGECSYHTPIRVVLSTKKLGYGHTN